MEIKCGYYVGATGHPSERQSKMFNRELVEAIAAMAEVEHGDEAIHLEGCATCALFNELPEVDSEIDESKVQLLIDALNEAKRRLSSSK